MEIKLSVPSPEFLEAYHDFCKETWGHVHDSYILHDPDAFSDWKNTIFRQYENEKNGIGLPPGIVPSVTYWLTSGDRCIGVANIRPKLNETLERYGGHAGLCIRPCERGKGLTRKILPLLFRKAAELGIGILLTTCTEENLQSIRVNEAFPFTRMERDEFEFDGVVKKIRRYWRDLSSAACSEFCAGGFVRAVSADCGQDSPVCDRSRDGGQDRGSDEE